MCMESFPSIHATKYLDIFSLIYYSVRRQLALAGILLSPKLGNTKMQNSDWNNATYHSMRSVIRWYLYLLFTCQLWCASHPAYFIWRATVSGSLPSDHVPSSRQIFYSLPTSTTHVTASCQFVPSLSLNCCLRLDLPESSRVFTSLCGFFHLCISSTFSS